MKPDYSAIDAAIVKAIRGGCAKFAEIVAKATDEARSFTTPSKWAWRVIDGRLQAIRKRGEIEFAKDGWRVVEREVGGA